MDMVDMVDIDDITAEKIDSGNEVTLPAPIDTESLIDVLQISRESWDTIKETAPCPRHDYFLEVALYNRKLELLKLGYYDVFEPIDERRFRDNLTLSLEGRMRIVNDLYARNSEGEETFSGESADAFQMSHQYSCGIPGAPGFLQSIIDFFTSSKECFST